MSASIFYVKSGLLFNADAGGDIGSALDHRPNNIYAAGSINAPNMVASSSLTIAALSGVLKASAGLVSGSATTSDLPEGSNLYYTTARVQSVGDIRYLRLDGANSPSADINWGGFRITNILALADSSSVDALNVSTRRLFRANASLSVDFQNSALSDGVIGDSLRWADRELRDAASAALVASWSSDFTLSTHLLFAADGAKDIGSPDGGATLNRPNNIFVANGIVIGNPAPFQTPISGGLTVNSQSQYSGIFVNASGASEALNIDTTGASRTFVPTFINDSAGEGLFGIGSDTGFMLQISTSIAAGSPEGGGRYTFIQNGGSVNFLTMDLASGATIISNAAVLSTDVVPSSVSLWVKDGAAAVGLIPALNAPSTYQLAVESTAGGDTGLVVINDGAGRPVIQISDNSGSFLKLVYDPNGGTPQAIFDVNASGGALFLLESGGAFNFSGGGLALDATQSILWRTTGGDLGSLSVPVANLFASTNINLSSLTPNRVVISDASDNLISSVVTTTELGYLSGIPGPINSSYLRLDGSNSPSADISWGSFRITNLANPVSPQDAVTKIYADNLAQGLSWKQVVRVASIANLNLASMPANIQGVVLASGDRFLAKDQTAPAENGLYVFNGAAAAATRSLDADTANELTWATVEISADDPTMAGSIWRESADISVIGTDPVTFVEVSQGMALVFTSGVQLIGNIVTAHVDNLTIDVNGSNQLEVKTGGITNTQVSASAAIAYSKLALSNSIVNADINASAAIAYSKLNLLASIVNSDVAAGAAIAYSKLALSNSIVNADINSAAAIAYSKLNLSASIVNADIATGAAIAYSKLALTNSIVNADINSAAAIAYSKLALSVSIKASDQNSQAATSVQALFADGAGGASYRSIVFGDLPPISHSSLTGLSADDHLQYLLLAGRSGGQIAHGGTAASNNLTLSSTAHATKGFVIVSDGSGLALDSNPANPFSPQLPALTTLLGGSYSATIAAGAGGNMVLVNAGSGANIDAYASLGTYASPTQFGNNNAIFVIEAASYNGSGSFIDGTVAAFNGSGTIILSANQAHTPSAMGTRWDISATPNGSLNSTTILRISGAGLDMRQASGANLIWNTDAAGNIGDGTAHDPGTVNAKNFIHLRAFAGNFALVSNASKNIVESVTTLAELAFVSGVTSSIQSQLNAITSGTGIFLRIDGTNSPAANISWANHDLTGVANLKLNAVGSKIYMGDNASTIGDQGSSNRIYLTATNTVAMNLVAGGAEVGVNASYAYIANTSLRMDSDIFWSTDGVGNVGSSATGGRPLNAYIKNSVSIGSGAILDSGTVVTTVGAVPQIVYTLPLANNSSYIVTAMIVGRSTAGGADRVAIQKIVGVYKEGGTAAIDSPPGADSTLFEAGELLWDATFSINGSNNLILTVTGSAGYTVDWKATVSYQVVS